MEQDKIVPTDWEEYYKDRQTGFNISIITRKISEKKLIKNINKFANKKDSIYELGGADSSFYLGFRKSFPNINFGIVDFSEIGCKLFEQKYGSELTKSFNKDILKTDLSTLEKADVVMSVGMIEHFLENDTAKCIEQHFNLTQKDGLVIITYPTPTWLYRLIRKSAEILKIWRFHDERPLMFKEVDATASKYGTCLSKKINWAIGLTQEIVVYRKN